MSLKSVYESFLVAPDATLLSPKASLNYITTLTTINDAEAIVKHLVSQHRMVVKKKQEKILSVVEGPFSLCVDVEVTLEFISGGGAYLPRLDDNFLTDKIVTLPMVHIVQFDHNKIQQMRVYWDQGSLLKQLGVIGSRGRNWPIHDGKDQAKLIAAVAKSSKSAESAPTAAVPVNEETTAPKEPNVAMTPSRSMSPTKKHISDPHASLALFAPEEVGQSKMAPAPGIATRASAKPAPRDYHDLFVGQDSDSTPTKQLSPKKEKFENVMAPKGAGGKNYQPSRLFENDGASHLPDHALYKSAPTKYNHFEFGDGSEEPSHAESKPVPMRPKSKGHGSQWAFEDFATPDKPRGKIRGQDVRHFGWSDDEGELAGSPGKQPRVIQPRRDAETHFEFRDDGTPGGEKRLPGRPKGSAHNTGLGLYQNNLYDEDGSLGEPKQQPLNTITNGINRKKDFGSQFTMTDSSPATKEKVGNENRPIADNRKKAVKMMESNWDSYDQSPEQQISNKSKPGALRKGTERHWDLEQDGETEANTKANRGQVNSGKSFWDF